MRWDGGLFLVEQENKDNFPAAAADSAGCTRNNLMHRERLRIMSEFEISFPRKKRREVFLKYWTIIAQVVELLRIASRKN